MMTAAAKIADGRKPIQCPNCDYICYIPDLVRPEGGEDRMLVCPSCREEYSLEWGDPTSYLSDKQIQEQIEWQKEIMRDGPMVAMGRLFLKQNEAEESE